MTRFTSSQAHRSQHKRQWKTIVPLLSFLLRFYLAEASRTAEQGAPSLACLHSLCGLCTAQLPAHFSSTTTKKKEPSMLNCACSSVGRTGYRDTKRAHEFFLPYLRCSLATTPSSRLTVSPLTAKAPASDLTTYSHITHVTVKSAQASLILSQKPSNWKKKKGTYTGY